MRKHLLLFLFLLNLTHWKEAHAQEVFSFFYAPPNPYLERATPQPKGNFTKLIIPLKHVQNLMMVEVTINGERGNLILDTGAPYLVLNKTYFRKGASETNLIASGITGKGGDVSKTKVKRLEIQELYYEDVEADITDLAQIENTKGVKVLGLMGSNLFSEFEIIIDVRRDLMAIFKLDKLGQRLEKEANYEVPDLKLPLMVQNNILYIDGKIRNKKLRFCFDSGAEVNVLSTKVDKVVLEDFAARRRSLLVGSGGKRAEVISGVLKQVFLADTAFSTMQTYLTPLTDLQRVYENYFDGILGYPLMYNGSVGINFRRKEFSMYLYRN